MLVALDRITKIWAVAALSGNTAGVAASSSAANSSSAAAQSAASAASSGNAAAQSFDFGLIDFTLVHNTGAAFGIGSQSTWLFIIIASVIVLGIILWLALSKNLKLGLVVALSLLAAGGIGNVVDRILFGYVVDFIEFTFIDFPVFNVADICVTAGVILLFIQVLFFGAATSSESAQAADNAFAGVTASSEPVELADKKPTDVASNAANNIKNNQGVLPKNESQQDKQGVSPKNAQSDRGVHQENMQSDRGVRHKNQESQQNDRGVCQKNSQQESSKTQNPQTPQQNQEPQQTQETPATAHKAHKE